MSVFIVTVVSRYKEPLLKGTPAWKEPRSVSQLGRREIISKNRFDGTFDIRNSKMDVSLHSGVVAASISGFWGESCKQISKIFKNSKSFVWKSGETGYYGLLQFQFKIFSLNSTCTLEYQRVEIRRRESEPGKFRFVAKSFVRDSTAGKGTLRAFPGAQELQAKFSRSLPLPSTSNP